MDIVFLAFLEDEGAKAAAPPVPERRRHVVKDRMLTFLIFNQIAALQCCQKNT